MTFDDRSNDKLLKKQKVKEVIPVSDPTLWRMEKQGLLVPVRIGQTRYWRKSDIARIVSGKAIESGGAR